MGVRVDAACLKYYTQGLHFNRTLNMRLTVGLDEKRPRRETRVDLRVRANGPQLQSSRCLCREKAVLRGEIAKRPTACHFKHFPERRGVAAQQFGHSVLSWEQVRNSSAPSHRRAAIGASNVEHDKEFMSPPKETSR